MIGKIAPLLVMGMAAQSFTHKKGKKMGDVAYEQRKKDRYEAQDKEIAKKAAKKKMSKSKCKSCGGKGCSKCSKGKY